MMMLRFTMVLLTAAVTAASVTDHKTPGGYKMARREARVEETRIR